jgi:uncharacterized integral membrane protein
MRRKKEPKPEETETHQEAGDTVEPAEASEARPAEPEKPKPPEPEKVYVGTGVSWAIVLTVVLIAFIAVVAARNTAAVTVDLIFWRLEAPLISIILGTAAAAVILDELVGIIWRWRRRRLLKQREELKRLKKEAT